VWCADITYVPMTAGYLYLVAVMDWFSRYVRSWELSNLMEAAFCVEALERALGQGQPEIFNSRQEVAFGAPDCSRLESLIRTPNRASKP
jgi:putative transposase